MNLNTTYQPKLDGKTKRINRIIEDMLRMYIMDNPFKWEYYIHLVEFSYKNGYQESLNMILFEALYGRKCNTTISWDNPGKKIVIGLEMLNKLEEQVENIR